MSHGHRKLSTASVAGAKYSHVASGGHADDASAFQPPPVSADAGGDPVPLELFFWRTQLLHRCVTSGVHLSENVFVHSDMWKQDGAKLTGLPAKVLAASTVLKSLRKLHVWLAPSMPTLRRLVQSPGRVRTEVVGFRDTCTGASQQLRAQLSSQLEHMLPARGSSSTAASTSSRLRAGSVSSLASDDGPAGDTSSAGGGQRSEASTASIGLAPITRAGADAGAGTGTGTGAGTGAGAGSRARSVSDRGVLPPPVPPRSSSSRSASGIGSGSTGSKSASGGGKPTLGSATSASRSSFFSASVSRFGGALLNMVSKGAATAIGKLSTTISTMKLKSEELQRCASAS